MADLDLTTGDPGRADEDTPASRRRRRRAESSSGSTTSSTRDTKQTEGEIRAGLARAFDGLAKARYARDDDELGDAITEEADAMTEGLVTLTDGAPFLRHPIVIILHLIITLLAFGRVIGILLSRAQQRREDRAQAAADAANGGEAYIQEVQ